MCFYISFFSSTNVKDGFEVNIKMLEQQKAKVLEAQSTIDHKIKEAEECKCKAEADKATKKVKRKKKRGPGYC